VRVVVPLGHDRQRLTRLRPLAEHYPDELLPWRSAFLAGAGVVSVVSGQIASWDAAVFRSDDIDPQVARYAFDVGNLSFANGWVAAGAVAVCAGLILVSGPGLPRWLGWWAILAGVGSVLARAVWTQDLAFLPFTVFWVWVAVVSALLVAGRLAVASVGDVRPARLPAVRRYQPHPRKEQRDDQAEHLRDDPRFTTVPRRRAAADHAAGRRALHRRRAGPGGGLRGHAVAVRGQHSAVRYLAVPVVADRVHRDHADLGHHPGCGHPGAAGLAAERGGRDRRRRSLGPPARGCRLRDRGARPPGLAALSSTGRSTR